MPAPRWEARWPGRLEYELQALRGAGIPYERDEAAWDAGVLKLHLRLDIHGQEIPATASYPEFYPDFRVRVDAEPLGLTHHQSPFGGNLCLLGRRGDQWQPEMTLAKILGEPLRRLLATGAEGADPTIHSWEDPQAEPFSAYYEYLPGSVVFVDGSWSVPDDVRYGKLVCGFLSAGKVPGFTLADGGAFPIIRCAVLEVQDSTGQTVAELDSKLRALYTSTFSARWIRLSSPVESPASGAAFEEARRVLPSRLISTWEPIPAEGGVARFLGILFPEETGHRSTGEGWVFAVHHQRRVKAKKTGRRGPGNAAQTSESCSFYARPMYVGQEDLSLRIPALRPLHDKTVAAFGLGSLGAPAVLELARGGVGELRILDGDIIDAGPTVRWPLGLQMVGENKALTIHHFLREHYPYTRVRSYPQYLGLPGGDRSDEAVLSEMLDGASLIFDVTAELDAQRFLSRAAQERGIPYVSVNGKPGGWGGIVFRHLPGVTRGCHECLLWSLQDGGPIPNPPADDATGVQARGCGDVTFTGTSFDMTTLALEGVRKAVGTLCGPEGGYPDGDWDVAVISFRYPDGTIRPPSWEVFKLDSDPRCDLCRGT